MVLGPGMLLGNHMMAQVLADTGALPAWQRQRVLVAPYALVRVSALAYPEPIGGAAARFRSRWRALVACERDIAALAGPLADALGDTRTGQQDRFHRQVVLPIRRDVHNGRSPRAQVRAALGDLLARLPLLAGWLRAVDERERLRDELARTAPAALAEDRAVLAQVCAAEPVRRAVALSSSALLRGMDRAAAAGPQPDARARKAEPRVLRYALRATSKTSPWSWFTSVGWGEWDAGAGSDLDELGSTPVSHPNRVLVASLVRALLAAPELHRRLPHRLAPAVTMDERQVGFRRDVVTGARRIVLTREEQVTLPRTGPLELVVSQVRGAGATGRTPEELAASLAGRLPAQRGDVAAAYVDRLVAEQLLVPVEPVDPQGVDALAALASWLDGHGRHDLAGVLGVIDRDSRGFAAVAATGRTEALRRLDGAWRHAFTGIGEPPADTPSVKEDVILPDRVALGTRAGQRVRADLARLAPLAELFDGGAVVRCLVRDQVVGRYGPGGSCRLAELIADGAELWVAAAAVAPDGTIAPQPRPYAPLSPELLELAALRREVTAAVRASGPDDGEAELPERVLTDVAAALPDWLLRRPSSHAWFVQPFRRGPGTGWCVNRVGGGWGRYGSRFLHAFGPRAIRAVAAQLRGTLGAGRVAQYRPSAGFNANQHPLLVADEVGEDPAWATLLADELELVHDKDTDEVRLRVAATGQPLDVLYLGFLVQPSLPDRAAPLYLDHAAGRTSLAHLAPAGVVEVDGHRVSRRARLRYGDVVIARRAWQLDPSTVDEWRVELERDGDVPVVAATRLPAMLGLPEATFVARSGPDPSGGGPGDLRSYLGDPKPQFVDLGSALHLRCLSRLLARHSGGVQVEEALPVPGDGPAGRRAGELIVETYRCERQP